MTIAVLLLHSAVCCTLCCPTVLRCTSLRCTYHVSLCLFLIRCFFGLFASLLRYIVVAVLFYSAMFDAVLYLQSHGMRCAALYFCVSPCRVLCCAVLSQVMLCVLLAASMCCLVFLCASLCLAVLGCASLCFAAYVSSTACLLHYACLNLVCCTQC